MSALRSIAAVLVLLVARAGATPPDDLARARAHFDAGQALYELGRYSDAVHEFSASYALTHRPELILNIGSCYRKLGDATAARDIFRKFLAQAAPDDPYRRQVVALLAEIEAQLAERPPPVAPAPPVVIAVAPPAPAPPVVPAVALPAPAPVIVAAPPHRSALRRHWWIVPVAAVVVAGVAVGIYFGVREANSPDCGATSLGCVRP